jgi:hypothetical protein
MIRNKEAERLAKQKEIWAKEKDLTKEEEVVSWNGVRYLRQRRYNCGTWKM